MTLDPRITPARPDLAAKHLEGKVEAARFAEGEDYEVIDARMPVRRAPSPDAPLDTEALLGEQDAIISDALTHASIIDGVRLCKARRLRYANNDMAELEARLIEALRLPRRPYE